MTTRGTCAAKKSTIEGHFTIGWRGVFSSDKGVVHLQLSPFSNTAPCDGSLLGLES